MATVETERRAWCGLSEGAAMLDVSLWTFRKLALEGRITVRDAGRSRARFLRSDIERLAREWVRPASNPTSEEPQR